MTKPPLYPLNFHDPLVRNMIIKEYASHGETYIKSRYGATRVDVYRWKQLQIDTGSLAPRYGSSGRTRSLTTREVKKLERALLNDPFLTNTELAHKVNDKITPRAVGNYINRSSLGFVEKDEATDVEASFTPRVVAECKAFAAEVKNIPLNKRIYVDETAFVPGSARRKGRFPKGKRFWRPKNVKYPRVTVIGAITNGGWLHKGVIYNKGSITTDDFNGYVKKSLAPLVKRGQVVFWDQLGRAGRAKHPTKLHYSPAARKAIEKAGATVKMLPPLGKYFNPIEPVWGDTKAAAEKLIKPLLAKTVPSKIPFDKKKRLWHKAESQLSGSNFSRAFKLRANGEEFIRVQKERE